jgi:hypothetical protein
MEIGYYNRAIWNLKRMKHNFLNAAQMTIRNEKGKHTGWLPCLTERLAMTELVVY